MAALPHSQSRAPINSLSLVIVVLVGLTLAVAVVAAGSWALATIFGAFFFFAFLRQPVAGLYLTTILLLVSGISIPVGGTLVTMPQSAAKLCGVAAIAAWAMNLLVTGKRFRATWEVWAVLAFAAWSLVGISMSMIWRIQIPEWTRLLTIVGYFILAVHVLDSNRKIHDFVIVLMGCGTAIAAYAILQYFATSLQFTGVAGIEGIGSGADLAFVDPEGTGGAGVPRVTGGTGHSNWLAFTLLLLLPLNAYWFATRESRGGKAVVLCATLIELVALVLTFTRLGLLVGVLIAVVLLAKSIVHLTPRRVCALILAMLLAWFALPEAYKERVIDFTKYSQSESTSARLELQHYAWDYMQDYPIVGIGVAGFGPRFMDENTKTAQMLEWMVKYLGWNPIYYGPHNFYLQLGAETGTVGLLIMLFFLVRGFSNAQRAEKLYRQQGNMNMALLAGCITVSVLAFIFCGLFLHALQQKIWWMVFAVATVLPICASRIFTEELDDEEMAEE